MMRNISFQMIITLVCLLFNACMSDEEKAKDVVLQLKQAVVANDTAKQNKLYPESTGFTLDKVKRIDEKNVRVKTENNRFTVYCNQGCCFFIEEVDGNFVIKDSRNLLSYNWRENRTLDLAIASGLVEKSPMTDVSYMKAAHLIFNNLFAKWFGADEDGDFLRYLRNKYPQASPKVTTVNVIKRNYSHFYSTKVIFTGGYGGVYVTATFYNTSGEKVAERTSNELAAPGELRNNAYFLIDTDVTGKIGKVDFSYDYTASVQECMSTLINCVSKSDYKEYLSTVKEK